MLDFAQCSESQHADLESGRTIVKLLMLVMQGHIQNVFKQIYIILSCYKTDITLGTMLCFFVTPKELNFVSKQ